MRNEYRAVVFDVNSMAGKEAGPAVFDTHGKNYITLDFKSLASIHSEYGYFAHEVSNAEMLAIKCGVLGTDESRILITTGDVEKLYPEATSGTTKQHFNHLMFSPSGRSFIAFFRYTSGSGRKELLLHHHLESGKTNILNAEMTSHCCWMDDDNIIGFMTHEGNPGCYRVNTETRKWERMFPLERVEDGHPSCRNGVLLFDSYPDASRMQHIYLGGREGILTAGSFYSPLIFHEYDRCDLHPRFNQMGNRIYFDSTHEGKRHLYTIEISPNE
jgi:hypothetical protein